MSIRINCEGVDKALADMKVFIDTIGGKPGQKVIANALNQSLAIGRKKAAKIARKAYTAPTQKLFDDIKLQKARGSNLEGNLELKSRRGVSLIHFKAQPNTPKLHPKQGVTAQVKRGGPRLPKRSKTSGRSKSFIMKKAQGGFGVFVRYKGTNKDGDEVDKFEMLMGPSPIQALQRKKSQEQVKAKVEEAFYPRLQAEVDKALARLGGK